MKRLVRIPAEGRLGGVCAGIGHYTGIDPTIIRFAWIVLSIVPGFVVGGLIGYLLALLLMPVSEAPPIASRGYRRLARSADRRVAGVCGGLAEYFEVDATVVRIVAVMLAVYPGALVGGGLAYGIAWLLMPPSPGQPMTAHTV